MIAGHLGDCSLATLSELYEDIFDSTLDLSTEHDIVIDDLDIAISRDHGEASIELYGAVSVNGHRAAEATIALSAGNIEISGGIANFSVSGVDVEDAGLDIRIDSSGFLVKFSGRVRVTDKHVFDVSVYLHKHKGRELEYTVYGAYDGEFYLHSLCSALKPTFLGDVALKKVAVCVSNMDHPQVTVKENLLAFKIERGLQVYAEAEAIEAVSSVLKLSEPKPFIVCA